MKKKEIEAIETSQSKPDSTREKYLVWTLFPYFGSWAYGLILVSIASFGTFVARRTIDPTIEIVSQNILNFLIEFNEIYVWVPVFWLLKESAIRMMELFVELKHKRN